MKVTWSLMAQASARRYMADQAGMHAINRAVAALAGNPAPPEAVIRGDFRRLRAGSYWVMYVVEGDTVTVTRVGQRSGHRA